MIRAIMFDLDGTLVQSEKLKAQSYAIAAQRLLGSSEPDARAVEVYREIVGAERHVASKHVMEQLEFEPYLRKQMDELGVSSPEEALSALRVAIYSEMVEDPQVVPRQPMAVHRRPSAHSKGSVLSDDAGDHVTEA